MGLLRQDDNRIWLNPCLGMVQLAPGVPTIMNPHKPRLRFFPHANQWKANFAYPDGVYPNWYVPLCTADLEEAMKEAIMIQRKVK
jgi:hypothetical protein